MKMLNILFLVTLVLTSCDKKDCDLPAESNDGLILSSFQVDNNCVQLDEFDNSYVIRTQQEYDSIKTTKANHDSCSTNKLNGIDFDKYTLLGFNTGGKCQVSYERKVIENKDDKEYMYSIKVNECGECKKMAFSMNWVLVPKIPNDWTVEFLKK